MKTSRVIQFIVAAVLVSVGNIALLVHGPVFIIIFSYCLSSVVLLRRSEWTRSVPVRDLWTGGAIVLVLIALIILANSFVPKSTGEQLVHLPVFVISLWALMLAALFWRWRKERRIADA